MTAQHVVIEADGGSRGNPGPAAYGAVLNAIPGLTVDNNGLANTPTMTFFTARGGNSNEGRMQINGMVVYAERMRENLERSKGVVFSGSVLLELARLGISREQAYEWVQRNAMRSFAEQRDFKELLLADPDITTMFDERFPEAADLPTR